jgi:hypothetical protein
MGGLVSVNFASFSAGGLKQVLAVMKLATSKLDLTRSSLGIPPAELPGVMPACWHCSTAQRCGRGQEKQGKEIENYIADPGTDRRVNNQ